MYGTVAAADGRVSGATAAAAAECMCGGVIIQHFMPLPEFRPPDISPENCHRGHLRVIGVWFWVWG